MLGWWLVDVHDRLGGCCRQGRIIIDNVGVVHGCAVCPVDQGEVSLNCLICHCDVECEVSEVGMGVYKSNAK